MNIQGISQRQKVQQQAISKNSAKQQIRRGKPSAPKIVLFDIELVEHKLNEQSRHSSLKPRLEAMLEEGAERTLSVVSKPLMLQLTTLKDSFPNFTDVIDHVHKTLTLMQLNDPAVIYIPPLLLVGEPGIGKTRFLRELAATLNVDFFQADLATTSAGFVLAGSSASWADGKPGLISQSLRQSKMGNPIFLLDEIDKVSGGLQYDPLGCLYTLLEKDTAQGFTDEALEIAMNCSAINWFASANYLGQIPQPIRSRFNVFVIDSPSTSQGRIIAQSVYADLLNTNTWGKRFQPQLSELVIDLLVTISPREQKKVLFDACCEAAVRYTQSRKRLLAIEPNDIAIKSSEPVKNRIGFY